MYVDINKIKNRLLVKYPFFGSIVVNLNYIESKECDTLGTDGKNIYYNSTYLENLTEDEQTFLFAHEVCHVAFDHISRSKGKDNRIWNIASDGVINAFLEKDGLTLVKGAVNIPGAINYNVEKLYQKLLKEKKQGSFNKIYLSKNNFEEDNNDCDKIEKDKNETKKSDKNIEENTENINTRRKQKKYNNKNSENTEQENQTNNDMENDDNNNNRDNLNNESIGNNNNNNQNEEQFDVGHDTHKLWSKKEETKQENSKIEKDDIESNNLKGNEEKTNQINYEIKGKYDLKKDLKEAVKQISEMEEIDAFVQNTSEKQKNLEELKKNLLNKAIGNKRASINVNRVINEHRKEEEYALNWKRLLREAINYNVDWSYENGYIENGVLKANLEEIKKPETEILLDTSGSINEIVLKNFLKECKNILKTSNVKVGCFDTKFYGFNKIKTVEDIDKIQILGHGGTNYYVAVNAFSRQVENKIIFTDGKALIPEKTMNIIWIVFGETKINVKKGRVIYIDNEQLRKLYINKIA